MVTNTDGMELLKAKIRLIGSISDQNLDLLLENATLKNYKKGEQVLPFGSICNHFYFVTKGAIRNYYIKEGRDVTEWIALDGSFCFSIISFFNEIPTTLATEALEDTELILIPKASFFQHSKSNLEIAELFRLFITGSLILSQYRMESIQFESAKQRYNHLIKTSPEILKRVPLMYIASYLGISIETLSRIRGQLS